MSQSKRFLAVTAAAVTALGMVGACSKDTGDAVPAADGGQVNLVVDTFGDFGYKALVAQYQQQNPNVKVELRSVQKLDDYKPKLTQYLAAGTGAGDVVALEEGILNEFKTQPQNFVNLLDHGAAAQQGDFLPWKWDLGKVGADGPLIGLGTDVGGLAVCYRKDLFAKAGLPTDRDAVSKLWPTWDGFISTGKKFTAANTGAKGFVDSVTTSFSAMLSQAGETNFYDRDNKLIADSNPVVKQAWDTSMKMVSEGVSAKVATWSKDWEAGFKNGSFAVTMCPSWMLGIIKTNSGAANAGKWDVAAVPGGGGNWGGSWLAVPTQSKHPKEAYELAKFLTSPTGQVAAFKEAGPLPSSPKALDDPAFQALTNDYFSKAPVGKIFGNGAKSLKPLVLGPKHQAVKERAFEPAMQAVEQGKLSADKAWQQALKTAAKEAK
ncbi:extracellular solute-binding protein family 1 [Kribbella flavida DSM 17836]|uniref:Extracellular solute-binding protein family 1 n=1 Tax=Kribbella flavida (strain DSM 17836 / JCM 10339 / NBRC 14399) TaxID=479435 RepID=D2PL20_KRIFD|nr:extracellular solute-binding protein [Kribbella flavida]ADB34275.1 extracellular solute-binding protein family 1 [Kribbella flavida DSM 17836]